MFRRASIPYRVVGAVSFYERREVRDLLAYLRRVVNPADDQAFLRAVQVPKRGIGVATLRTLQDTASQWTNPLLATAAIADRISEVRPLAKQALQDFAGVAADRIVDADETGGAAVHRHQHHGLPALALLLGPGRQGAGIHALTGEIRGPRRRPATRPSHCSSSSCRRRL